MSFLLNSFLSGGYSFSFGNALQFDGENDYVSIPQVDLGDFTFSCWFSWSGLINNFILSSSVANSWIQPRNTTRIAMNLRDYGFEQFTLASSLVNGWHHLFITRDASSFNVNVWVDGVASTSNPITMDGRTVDFDQISITGAAAWGDKADELAIWSGVIGTEQNAIDLYNSGAGALASDIIPNPNRYYRFDESSGTTLTDIGSDLQNGTLQNFADPDSNWIPHSFSFGNALLFDGDNDYLSIASSIINDFSLTGACLSIWVKFNSTPSFQYICGDGTSWWFSVNSLSTCRANGLSTKTLQTAIVVGQWNHFFISRQDSNDNWRIFHNGQEVTGSPEVDVEKFTIRYFATRDTTFPLDGVLDEIAYWEDVVGTEQNAIDLYNSGNGALASDVIPNPNRFYRLDESSGAVATDSGTDLVNGVLTNFANPDSNWIPH